LPAPASRAQHIAARLSAAKCEPHVTHRPDHIRVEAELPDELSETDWQVVLAALASADRFGDARCQGRHTVWAAISTPGPDGAGGPVPAPRTTCEPQERPAAESADAIPDASEELTT
jgi:hypothetical protein